MPAHDHDLTLGDYLDAWLQRQHTQLRPTTLHAYRGTIERYLRPHLGSEQLTELDRRTLDRTYAQLLATGGQAGQQLSPRTVQLAHAVLSSALSDAVLDGLLPSNPAQQASPPSRDPSAVDDDDLQVWTFGQVRRFLQAIDDHQWRALWHLAIGTGARRGELLGLRWCDTDLDGATVRFRRSLSVVRGKARLLGTKNSQARAVALGASVVDSLRRREQVQAGHRRASGTNWRNEWDLVFSSRCGRNLHPDSITAEFRRIVAPLDVPTIRFHDLRHTHASLLLGTSMKVISDRLGHAGITTTMETYVHLRPAMDQDAAAALKDILDEADD